MVATASRTEEGAVNSHTLFSRPPDRLTACPPERLTPAISGL